MPSNDSNKNPATNFHIEFDNDKVPEGFSKIKLDDEASLGKWRDCATSTGYLKRLLEIKISSSNFKTYLGNFIDLENFEVDI